MLKRNKYKLVLIVGLGLVLTMMLGGIPSMNHWLSSRSQVAQKLPESSQIIPNQTETNQFSTALTLASLPAEQRALQLESLAKGNNSIDSIRANYLLAADSLAAGKAEAALVKLQNLESSYPLLAPYVLLKEGQAYQLKQENLKAQSSWQKIITKYPDSFAAAEALYLLGKTNPQYWEEAITKFPNYPRTHEIAKQLLKKTPDRFDLMVMLAQYASHDEDTQEIRDRLVKKYASRLTAKNWQAIADGYWDKFTYAPAANAYLKAPRNSHNLYRAARSMHLSARRAEARKYYQQLIKTSPQAEEIGLALRRLASLSPRPEALKYLDLAIRNHPKEAAKALLTKAETLEKLKDRNGATNAYKLLLTKYPSSEAAAEYRWNVAKKQADAGDLTTAWQWAQQLVTDRPDSDLAPRASFWVGKWAMQLNRPQEAQTSFRYVLDRYPQSYYAWRSAQLLGWKVGDFNSIRSLNPQVQVPNLSFTPSAGSALFQELYSLGQQEEAWNVFAAEMSGKEELSVYEQYTSGLLHLARGNSLKGINLIGSLQDREDDRELSQWQSLRQNLEYWYALFPFPYNDTILKWAGVRQLNPLLVTSLIRQESRFEAKIRSLAGAMGLMQVMPETAKGVAKEIKLAKYSLTNPEDNINLGTYYLDFTHRRYDNNSLFAVASYNAGPHRIAKWIDRFGISDLDLFVEKIPFSETQGYVESVFANYWNYLRLYNPEISQLVSARQT
jgi:soluble lytic murein transglycosylase